ncbi:hypothetical protein AN958_05932 [Leucoagaricus sp. SymC.cos]|nr:hypothetical protein AN958_05932 [Leucoagaricus sp. SymC.cos]
MYKENPATVKALSPAAFHAMRSFSAKSSDQSGDDWLSLVEAHACSPDLSTLVADHSTRLGRAFTLGYNINLFLTRPEGLFEVDAEERRKFQREFVASRVPLDSEITRGRHAVALNLIAIAKNVMSIPSNSSLRQEDPIIFQLAEKMQTLIADYLQDVSQGVTPTTSEIVSGGRRWGEFWLKAQGLAISLSNAIGEAGYGSIEHVGEYSREAAKKTEDKFWEIIMEAVAKEKAEAAGGGGPSTITRGRRRRR